MLRDGIEITVALLVLWGLWGIKQAITAYAEEQRHHLLRLQSWLFDSLYSIDNNVKLPDTYTKEGESRPAAVTSIEDDPMSEFTGHLQDWYGAGRGDN